MLKSAAKSLEHSVKESTAKYFGDDPFFIFGVSGGPDSMALLYLFHKLNINALVVHINYAKRGKASDLDQELVEEIAFQWGFECSSVKVNPEEANNQNFQNWARDTRYQMFRDLKELHKADAIVTAHHQNDQVETILQKLFRGSSPSAWQGMKVFDGELFRPMLNFPKQQILDFCEAEAVPYRIDESNRQSSYARNFIRHELAKNLDKFFPGWTQNILALREQGELFDESIRFIANQMWNGESLDVEQFSSLPKKLKSAVIKVVLNELNEKDVSKGQLAELAKSDKLQVGKQLEVGAHVFIRNRGKVHVIKKEKAPSFSLTITKENTEAGLSERSVSLKKSKKKAFKDSLNIDFEKLRWPLKLRQWKAGDVFQPLGMSGMQKISDHLTNRKISSHLKEKALVLCGSDGTIYAIIYPEPARNMERGAIAELVKCEAKTTTYLTITIKE